MDVLVLKLFIRCRLIISPCIILLFVPIEIAYKMNLMCFYFIALQYYFTSKISQIFNIKDLLLITHANTKRLLMYYNIYYFFAFNAWFMVKEVIKIRFFLEVSDLKISELLLLETLLLTAIIIGNLIAYSDLENVSNKLWRWVVKRLTFIIALTLTFLLFFIISMIKDSVMIWVGIILLLILIWRFNLRSENIYINAY